jgi:uncharacterized repeat protein (TIGR01451 family)
MLPRLARLSSLVLVLFVLASVFPAAVVTPVLAAPQSITAAQTDPTTPASAPIVAQAVATTPAPGLSLTVAIGPDPVPIGETATISITVANRSPSAANNLVVIAPTPDGAVAERGPVTVTPIAGWRWNVGQLPAEDTTTVTGTLRLVRAPTGDAVVATAQATADGLPTPASATGGAMAIDRAQGPATAAFTPGTAATLRSSNGRVTVQLPPRPHRAHSPCVMPPRLSLVDACRLVALVAAAGLACSFSTPPTPRVLPCAPSTRR